MRTGSCLSHGSISPARLLWSTDLFNFASPIDGTNVVQVYTGGQYSGFYRTITRVPGDIFTGDCWIYVSSLDPLTGFPPMKPLPKCSSAKAPTRSPCPVGGHHGSSPLNT